MDGIKRKHIFSIFVNVYKGELKNHLIFTLSSTAKAAKLKSGNFSQHFTNKIPHYKILSYLVYILFGLHTQTSFLIWRLLSSPQMSYIIPRTFTSLLLKYLNLEMKNTQTLT